MNPKEDIPRLPTAAAAPVVNPKYPGRWRKNIHSLAKARRRKELEQRSLPAFAQPDPSPEVLELMQCLHALAGMGEMQGFVGIYSRDGELRIVSAGTLRDDAKWHEVLQAVVRFGAGSLGDR